MHQRLSSVVIECLGYETVLERYDRQETLFYLDPPYWGFENYYGEAMFERKDFETLNHILGKLKGKFLMSLNDVEGVRECFKDFHIEQLSTTYSAGGKQKRVKELLISNVPDSW